MSCWTLLFRTLIYHWRTNLAVVLGVVAGTAVIGGALIVGDSVRGSLHEMTSVRLGPVDQALTGPRFVRERLARELEPLAGATHGKAMPAIVLAGSFEKPVPGNSQVATRAGRVNVVALNEADWDSFRGNESVSAPVDTGLVLNDRLARELEVSAGTSVTLTIELPGDIPRDALLGKRDQSSVQIPLTVSTVLESGSRVGRFGLRPDQQLPLNAFVSLTMLQERLGLAAHEPTPRDPRTLPARVNTIFATQAAIEPQEAKRLTGQIQRHWQLDDLHARMIGNDRYGYLSLESDRMILDRQMVAETLAIAERFRCRVSPVLAYIANEISVVERDGRPVDPAAKSEYSRYSIVAGLDPEILAADAPPPFGPFRYQAPEVPPALGEGAIEQPDGVGEIVINDWLARDLTAKVGDVVRLAYHIVGSHGELPDLERRFAVRGIVALDDTVAADRGLIPEVHGITDVDSFDDWDAPFPMKPVTRRDDEYWKKYRATPKAFITLKSAQHLWSSRYGDLTSLRIAPVAGETLEDSRGNVTVQLLKRLKPEELGLAFQPVKYLGYQAASGTTDFGGLFIGFSFFLILSAMILIGLLFRLGIERRAANVGLLLATGFSPRVVGTLLFAEGLVVVVLGGVAGVFGAIGYAAIIIHGLKTWWFGAIGTRFLDLYVVPGSLGTGLGISAAAALGAIWWGIRGLWKLSPRGLLSGITQPAVAEHDRRRRARRALWIAHALVVTSLAATAAVVTRLIPGREAFAGFSWPTIVFFLVGLNTLVAGLAYLSAWVGSDGGVPIRGAGMIGAGWLGTRNAARHRSRSVLSTALIASATFLIVAIAAGHRNPAAEAPDRTSGNGGFTLVAESTVPILYDLNTAAGRSKLDLDEAQASLALAGVTHSVAFRVNPGDNASCLNIYQTSQPTILGVPAEMIQRGGFKFVGAGSGNPWELLREPTADGSIPVLGDMNTLQYSLHIGPGQTLDIRAEDGTTAKARIAGMLDGSVFQGVLLMEETAFQKLFPSRVGYQYFLIEVPVASATVTADLLESKLPGFDAERVADRLASFLAVQNTYLSTFQALGGLGLLLGTIGLATVMLRNVLERRSELALLRAVGFRDLLLASLVLCENALLLGWGLVTGASSALLAMLPHLLSTGADVPWRDVAVITGVVFVVGMLAALVAVRASLKTPVLATLRAE